MNIALIVQVIQYIVANKDEIAQMVNALEVAGAALVGDLGGADKAAIVQKYIALQANITADLGPVWTVLSPFFNAFVAKVKAA